MHGFHEEPHGDEQSPGDDGSGLSDLPTRLKDALDRLNLTQRRYAQIIGVTQPAVFAWLNGIRRPTGRRLELVRRTLAAVDMPVIEFGRDRRRRPLRLPARPWKAVADPLGSFRLPVSLDWSPAGRVHDLSDPAMRASIYRTILSEGQPKDFAFWIDLDAMLELWDSLLWLPREVRAAWDELLASGRLGNLRAA